ncbi:fibrinogen-like protein A [Zophobas morio]|uniref:fibrinogen-like protein A n=1 Tax=Zophobas morio TaxID=2755281 RepID=UPI003082E4EE
MKMIRKSFFIVCLFLNLFLFSCEYDQEKFDVGSRTRRSPDSLRIEEALTNQINRFQENVNRRLQFLATENMYQLEQLNLHLETFDTGRIVNIQRLIYGQERIGRAIDSKLEQLTHRLRTFKSKNAKRIERLTSHKDAPELTIALFIETRSTLGVLESAYHQQFEQITDSLKSLDSKNESSLCLRQSTKANFPRNCREIKELGYGFSTIYTIKPDSAPKATRVRCDLKKREGGWTYILNRFDGSQNFDFDMDVYKNGFGKLSGEFWLGLDNIHYLTGYKVNELLVELVDWDENYRFAHYDRFRVGSKDEGYIVTVSGYNGTAGDSLSFIDKVKFAARYFDLYKNAVMSGSQYYLTTSWYKTSLLTGKYLKGHVHENETRDIMHWSTFRGNQYSLKEARMMVRPRIEPND